MAWYNPNILKDILTAYKNVVGVKNTINNSVNYLKNLNSLGGFGYGGYNVVRPVNNRPETTNTGVSGNLSKVNNIPTPDPSIKIKENLAFANTLVNGINDSGLRKEYLDKVRMGSDPDIINAYIADQSLKNVSSPYNEPTLTSGILSEPVVTPKKDPVVEGNEIEVVDTNPNKDFKILTDRQKNAFITWAMDKFKIGNPLSKEIPYDLERAFYDEQISGKPVTDLSPYLVGKPVEVSTAGVNPLQNIANQYKPLPNITRIEGSILNKLGLPDLKGMTPEKIIETENMFKNKYGSITNLVDYIEKEYVQKNKELSPLFKNIYNNYKSKITTDPYLKAYDSVMKVYKPTPNTPTIITSSTVVPQAEVKNDYMSRALRGEGGNITATNTPTIDFKNIPSLKNATNETILKLEQLIKQEHGSLKAYADLLKTSKDVLTDYQIWIRDNLGTKEVLPEEKKDITVEEPVIEPLKNLSQLKSILEGLGYTDKKILDEEARGLKKYGSFDLWAAALQRKDSLNQLEAAIRAYYYPVKPL